MQSVFTIGKLRMMMTKITSTIYIIMVKRMCIICFLFVLGK